jgi:BatD DUF11 like domain
MKGLFYALSFLLCCVCQIGQAQDMSFVATVTANKVGTQNQFQVEYKLNNAARFEGFVQPNLSNFNVVAGPVMSSSFSSINGSAQSSRSYTFVLQPKAPGKFMVPALIAIIDGKSIQSNTCNIEVVKGKLNLPQGGGAMPFDPHGIFSKQTPQKSPYKIVPAPQPEQQQLTEADLKDKVFAQIDIDKKTAVVGEQITAEYNVYTRLPLQVGISKPTSPEGFWVQDYAASNNPQQSERVVINGRDYRKHTLRKIALFATGPGKHTIPAVELEAAVQIENNEPESMADEIISGLFGKRFTLHNTQEIPVTLNTKNVEVNILALPANKPEEFMGTVGNFNIESAIDRTELTTDETALLTITLRGNGNIKMLGRPQISFPGDFEVFDPVVYDTISSAINDISGFKTFKYVLQPRNAGQIHIPAASFTYYDAVAKEYKTITTTEYTLKVSPGKNKAKIGKKNVLPQDLHDIVNDDTMKKQVVNLLPEKPYYWVAFLLPILALLGANVYAKRKEKKAITPQQEEQRKVTNVALQRLTIAQEMLKENNALAFYNETSKALILYVSDKMSIPLSKLNKQSADQLLADNNVTNDVRNLLANTTETCEQVLYSGEKPSPENMKIVFDNAVHIITQLEAQII